MKSKKNSLKGLCMALLLTFASQTQGMAKNTTTTVSQVTSGITVSAAVDYMITSTTPFATAGSVDLTGETSTLILKNVIPSVALSTCMDNIYVNGEKAVDGTNCTVSIYNTGCIVLPYTVASSGLTLYTGENCTGESKTYYPSAISSLPNGFNNNVRSFKLRRGYMANLATSSGRYNRTYVASDSDIVVNALPNLLNAKVSVVRVLRWQWPSKKAYSGTDQTYNARLNTTSFYGWNASDYSRVDREYVPQHHHIGWPSIGEVTGHSDCTAILGNNEPDNGVGGEQKVEVSDVLSDWREMEKGGQRIGSPAVAGDYNNWLYPFIDAIDANGYRCDFVAVHAYWNSSPQNFMNSLKNIYNRTGRPLWITEFNYGANWTTETWPTADRSASAANVERMRAWMAELIPLLDAAPYVERYFIYNWVQDCRAVYLDGNAAFAADNYLTPAGKAYANTSTGQLAYNCQYEVIPKFVYKAPSDLNYTYAPVSKAVTLTWTNANGEQTDTAYVERQKDGGEWVAIDTLFHAEALSNTFRDELANADNGVYTYRIRNIDSDGKERTSATVAVTKAGAEGEAGFQYGTLELHNTEYTYTTFEQLENEEFPAVIVGQSTFNNKTQVSSQYMAPVPHLASVNSKQFKFQYFPMVENPNQNISVAEASNFLILKKGNYTFGDMSMEVAATPTRVGNDTMQVTFNQPFPAGETPVVLATVLTTQVLYPFMVKIWDVTNTGFKIKLMREEGLTYAAFPAQNVNYLAVSQGRATLDNGQLLTAGITSDKIGGKALRQVHLANADGTDYLFEGSPLLLAQEQTYNMDAASILRSSDLICTESETTCRFFRQVDASTSVTTNSATINGDLVGWLMLSDDPNYTGIGIVPSISETLNVSVENGYIRVQANEPYAVYTLNGTRVNASQRQMPGLYIVRCGTRVAKVMVR